MLLNMETETSKSCEQQSSFSATGKIFSHTGTTTTSSDLYSSSNNAHNNASKLSSPQTTTPAKNTMNPTFTCPIPNTTSHGTKNIQTGSCMPAQSQSLNTYPAAVSNLTSGCDYTQHRMMNTSTFRCNSPGSDIIQNKNMQYISCDQTDSIKLALQSANNFSFSSSCVPNDNMNSDPCFIPPSSQNFMYTFPKSLSLTADYEMPSGILGSVNASTTSLVAHEINLVRDTALVHSVSSEYTQHSATKTTKVPETIFHGLPWHLARGSGRSLLPPPTTRHDQPTIVADATGDAPAFSPNAPTRLPRKGSDSEYPSPRMSDFGSEDKHGPVNHESFAQIYASLTPWTSKLTAPGYTPLPVPAPDAMPIPLEHVRKEYVLSMPPPSQKTTAKSSHTRERQIYSHLKPSLVFGSYCDNVANNKTKNGYYSRASRPSFKVQPNKEYRFRRTAEALQKSGLWEVAMKTGNLIKRNMELQKELEEFRSDAVAFLKSVIKDPQNRNFIKNVLNTALTSNTVSRNGSSVMAVVVSAAAAAAAATSSRIDSSGSSDGDLSN